MAKAKKPKLKVAEGLDVEVQDESKSKPKTKLKVDECLIMLKYLAKHEKNARVIGFLDDRGIVWSDA